jgi:hypothetical protein
VCKDRAKLERDALAVRLYATNLARAGESLLTLTSEVKRNLLLADQPKRAAIRREDLDKALGDSGTEAGKMQREIMDLIHELEQVYWASFNLEGADK